MSRDVKPRKTSLRIAPHRAGFLEWLGTVPYEDWILAVGAVGAKLREHRDNMAAAADAIVEAKKRGAR